MIDILPSLDRWRREGRRVVLARVIATRGSAPLPPGASMAVNDRGDVVGSVSGGCVEGAVVERALAVLEDRAPAGVVSFGYSDADGLAVGLTCGGTVEVYVEPFDW